MGEFNLLINNQSKKALASHNMNKECYWDFLYNFRQLYIF